MERIVERIQKQGLPFAASGMPVGFFDLLRLLFGELQVYYVYDDNPEPIHKMCSYFCDIWINLKNSVIV